MFQVGQRGFMALWKTNCLRKLRHWLPKPHIQYHMVDLRRLVHGPLSPVFWHTARHYHHWASVCQPALQAPAPFTHAFWQKDNRVGPSPGPSKNI